MVYFGDNDETDKLERVTISRIEFQDRKNIGAIACIKQERTITHAIT